MEIGLGCSISFACVNKQHLEGRSAAYSCSTMLQLSICAESYDIVRLVKSEKRTLFLKNNA